MDSMFDLFAFRLSALLYRFRSDHGCRKLEEFSVKKLKYYQRLKSIIVRRVFSRCSLLPIISLSIDLSHSAYLRRPPSRSCRREIRGQSRGSGSHTNPKYRSDISPPPLRRSGFPPLEMFRSATVLISSHPVLWRCDPAIPSLILHGGILSSDLPSKRRSSSVKRRSISTANCPPPLDEKVKSGKGKPPPPPLILDHSQEHHFPLGAKITDLGFEFENKSV
ncbi:hypothetical protein MIMGU_mgv11b022082mg [Erythranthe guttata]|uniref:Uncharacterized protein n=1 Tax=Erythranthe guttata TaxID=4155 RepID=A0A022Q7H3_ERYGU|nr:hypothetical protein MIMGU_mgv11b022082mg [Erythranthe guttata]